METVSIAVVVILAVASFYFLAQTRGCGHFTGLGVIPLMLGSYGAHLLHRPLPSVFCYTTTLRGLGVPTLLSFEYMATVPLRDFGIFPEKIFVWQTKTLTFHSSLCRGDDPRRYCEGLIVARALTG